MDLVDQLRALGERIEKQLEQIGTEEAAKTAFVMPFIQALGFNVFDPTEVVPEFTADVGTKKGEKVDYAIQIGGEPLILFECKWEGNPSHLSDKHVNQLYRYFSVTKARIGVLTNGVIYRFYSDLEDRNKMDSRPFLVLDLRSLDPHLVGELKRLTKEAFDLDSMLSTAGELKYLREIRANLDAEFAEPSEEFVRLFFSRVCPGRRLTESAREQFSTLVKRSVALLVRDRVDQRLKSALSADSQGDDESPAEPAEPASTDEASTDGPAPAVETTAEELEGYAIVKSLLHGIVDPERVVYRDAKTYFAILLDDNNRKPICRLRFNGVRKKHISLFDADKNETKVPVDGPNGIFAHAEALKKTVGFYGDGTEQHVPPEGVG